MALVPVDQQNGQAGFEEADRRLKGSLSGPPTEHEKDAQIGMVEEFCELYANIYSNIEPGRLRSIALTKLEEAKMFAVAAIFEK